MDTLKIDSRKLDLLKRSNDLLEKTKKNYKKFVKERKLLLELTTNKSTDYDEWENILRSIEYLINSNNE